MSLARCAAVLMAALMLLATTPARAEVSEVKIAIQFGLVYLPVAVAESQGYFASEARTQGLPDLKVAVQRFSGSPAVNDAVLSGNVEVGAYGVPGLLIAWDKTMGRMDVRGIAALAAHPFILDTNRPNIKKLADFTDQDRIATPATTSPQAILMRMAAEEEFGPGQYARIDKLLVSMPHPDATAALLAGTISGYVATPPFIAPLAKSEKIHAVITSKQILGGEEATGAALGAGKKFVDANPRTVAAIVAALDDARDFIAKDPGAAADIWMKSESSKMPRSEVLQMLTDGTLTYSVAPTGILKFAHFMAKTGEIKKDPASWQDVFFPVLGGRQGS